MYGHIVEINSKKVGVSGVRFPGLFLPHKRIIKFERWYFMNSLNYLGEIKNSYLLNNDDLIDIIEKLSYIARDNGEDDTILTELMDARSEM